MTALWIAGGFIVGSIFATFTMCLAFAAKSADRHMSQGYEDSTVEKSRMNLKCKNRHAHRRCGYRKMILIK